MRKLALVALLALATAPAAEAKFTMSLTVWPEHVWVKQPARVTLRTSIVLPRRHYLRLHVVGPWHPTYGNAFIEPRLHRTGPKTYTATVRFPRGGRWRLIVPNWAAPGSAYPPPVDRVVNVQPSP